MRSFSITGRDLLSIFPLELSGIVLDILKTQVSYGRQNLAIVSLTSDIRKVGLSFGTM